jgi:hypothetical protein
MSWGRQRKKGKTVMGRNRFLLMVAPFQGYLPRLQMECPPSILGMGSLPTCGHLSLYACRYPDRKDEVVWKTSLRAVG